MSLSGGSQNGKNTASSAPAPKDAEIKVVIKDNGMTACVNISSPENGGRPPTAEAIAAELKKHVKVDIDENKLRILEQKPVYNLDIVVASGRPPVNGEDGSVQFLMGTDKKGKPRQMENGRVDYFDLGLIQNVQKGQVLCVIKLPTEGTPGMTVRGEVIRPMRGKPANIVAGPNTELSPDGTKITSKINGHFEFDGKRVSVSETYTLNEDVGAATGNIKVAGNLVIRGGVSSGFTVEAGGYVNISGVVESATVISGGDMNLQGGANGSTISCGGNLKCRYIENCSVTARGDIRAEYVFNSNVRCNRSLKTEGPISKIIGGTCTVGQDIECRTIGSASGIRTRLEIGTDPEIIERQKKLTLAIPELEKQIRSLEPLLKLLKQLDEAGRLTEEKREMLEKASYSYGEYSRELESAKSELEEISALILNKTYGKVTCTDTIYPGTVVVIGSATYTVAQEMKNACLFYSDGDITFRAAR